MLTTVILSKLTDRNSIMENPKMTAHLLTVKKEGAERLWSYILAYRKMIGKSNPIGKEETATDNITFIVAPAVVQAKVSRRKRKN